MSAGWAERALVGLMGVLDGTSPTWAGGLNGAIARYREQAGLTSTDLPDIGQFQADLFYGSQATSFPACSVVWEESRALNGRAEMRMMDHRFRAFVVILDANIPGNEAQIPRAMVRYAGAFHELFSRQYGQGDAGSAGRVLFEAQDGLVGEVEIIRSATYPTDGLSQPNGVLDVEIRVITHEEY